MQRPPRVAPCADRPPTPADLADPATAVVDVGGRHEPALGNFDHHQLPKDVPPTCSLSLVLQHLGLYDDARQFCDWLEPAEWFDCRGLITTAKWLGATPATFSRLTSPVDITLLRRFALATRLEPDQPLWEVMRMVGEDLPVLERAAVEPGRDAGEVLGSVLGYDRARIEKLRASGALG